MPRVTPPDGAAAFALAARGVYVQPFLVKGHYEIVAVASDGEQVAVRHVKQGRPTDHAEAELWAELDDMDPIMPHERAPSLRLL